MLTVANMVRKSIISSCNCCTVCLYYVGLSAPVPRGRKGKKVKTQASTFDIHKAEWLRKYNPEHLLQDDGYKKHIKHHCNK